MLIVLLLIFLSSLSAFEGYLDIMNETGYDIYYVYISQVGDDSWGNDKLGDIVIYNGETHRIIFTEQPSLEIDILVEDVDGDRYTVAAVNLADTDLITFTRNDMNQEESDLLYRVTIEGPGGEFSGYIELTNRIGRVIKYVYLRDKINDWGPDLLGEEIFLDEGVFEVTMVNFPDSIFDVKFEDRRGKTYTFISFDLDSDSLTVTPQDKD